VFNLIIFIKKSEIFEGGNMKRKKIFILFVAFILLPFTSFAGGWSSMLNSTTNNLLCIWGSSGSSVFAVGWNGSILYYNGDIWSTVSLPPAYSSTFFYGVWGSSSSDVFVVGGSGTILHYNGRTWSAMPTEATDGIYGIWGRSGTYVYAVGVAGLILHYNGDSWSPMASGTANDLLAIWGSSTISGSDLFAVGLNGTILHYNGSTWSSMSSGTTAGLTGIWGRASNDLFAVGGSGIILYYNGSSWSSMASEITEGLFGIWGRSGNNVFAVGEKGTIVHYNEGSWSLMNSGTIVKLSGIWGSTSGDVFAVGDKGTILHYEEMVTTTTVPGTTTTTAPGNTTTTTTTAVPGICPSKTVMCEDSTGINTLRVFRNEMFRKTEMGKYYTALYYKHALELSYLFTNDQELRAKAKKIIQALLPTLEGYISNREVPLPDNTIHEALAVIDAVKKQASPVLAKDLCNFRQDIQDGVIMKNFGFTVQSD
jgi:hypothetical protein